MIFNPKQKAFPRQIHIYYPTWIETIIKLVMVNMGVAKRDSLKPRFNIGVFCVTTPLVSHFVTYPHAHFRAHSKSSKSRLFNNVFSGRNVPPSDIIYKPKEIESNGMY